MVLTSFAFLLHRNWSARTGELHAGHGLELSCWWSVEQNAVAVNAAVCAGGNQAGEGCRAATAGFVDMTPHSGVGSRPGSCASLTKPECNGRLAAIVLGVC